MWESYLSSEMQSIYFSVPADRATLLVGVLPLFRDAVDIFFGLRRLGYTPCGNLTSLQRCSRYIFSVSADWVTLLVGVLPLFRDAVDIFFGPADWATLLVGVLPLFRDAVDIFFGLRRLGYNPCWSLTSLQRCSRYIFRSPPTRLHSLWESYLSSEMQSIYFSVSAD